MAPHAANPMLSLCHGCRRPSAWLAICLVVVAAAAAPAERGRVLVQLAEGGVGVDVEASGGPAGWAHYYRGTTARYLEALERYLEVPFHHAAAPYFAAAPAEAAAPPAIRLIGRQEVVLQGQRVGGLNNSAGLFDAERAILVEYGLAGLGTPALVLHELGHFYFYDLPDGETAWLTEGIASFLPLAVAAAGELQLVADEAVAIASHWGAGSTAPAATADLPLGTDFRFSHPNRFGLWYEKTFKVQLILYAELGADGYRQLLRAVLADRTVHATTSGVVATLTKLQPGNWDKVLSGWVSPGLYGTYPWGQVPSPPHAD